MVGIGPAAQGFVLEPKVRDKKPPGGSSSSSSDRDPRGKKKDAQSLSVHNGKGTHVTSTHMPLAKAVSWSSLKLLGREIYSAQDEAEKLELIMPKDGDMYHPY